VTNLEDHSDNEDTADSEATPEDVAAMQEVHETAEALVAKVVGSAAERSKIKVVWKSRLMREITANMPFGSNDPDANSKTKREGGKAKKWIHSHRIYHLLADFLGNAVVIPAAGDNDVDVDTEVFKLLSCLNESTPLYLRAFFESRRLGHAVSGGTRTVQMCTVVNDMKPLGHLFARVRLPLRLGGGKLCPDCSSRGDEFRAKSSANIAAEQGRVRGTHCGNPMRDLYVNDFRKDGLANARAEGERPRSNAAVTELIMCALYRFLVLRHVPLAAPTRQAPRTATEISDIKSDFLRYCVYAFSFMTLARPVTTLNLRHKDILTPQVRSPMNSAFLRKYACVVWLTFIVSLSVCLPCVDMNHLRCRPITSRSVTFFFWQLSTVSCSAGLATLGTLTLSAVSVRPALLLPTSSPSVFSVTTPL